MPRESGPVRIDQGLPRTTRSGASPGLVLTVMCVGYFLVLLDVTIVNVALPSIGSALHADLSSLQWVVDAYSLALAGLMLGAGAIGDRHGHKPIVMSGLALVGVASLGCGLAPGPAVLIACRALQGAAAALLLPGTLAVIAQTFPQPAARARAIGTWAGIGSIALPAGPLVGGALVQSIGWRAVFLVNVPIVVPALAVARRVVVARPTRHHGRPDFAGIAVGAALPTAVTFALIEAGRQGLDPAVVGASLVAVGLAVALPAVERRAATPILPPTLLRSPGFVIANAVAGTMNLASLGLLFVLTLYLQQVEHRSALEAGVRLVPLFAPLSVLAPLAGRVVARTGPRLPMTIGLLLAAAGMAGLAVLDGRRGDAALLPTLVLWGVGLGILTPAVVTAAVHAVPAGSAGLASGVNNTARQAGGAVGIAALGALAGRPAGSAFLHGFHAAALIGAALLLVCAAATLRFGPPHERVEAATRAR